MADLAETTEALKRNFLFRGFFNRRGYFDLADVSVERVSAGRAGEQGAPRAAASGFGPTCCSRRDAKGVERLTTTGEQARFRDVAVRPIPAGRARSSWKDTRSEPTADERFLLSRSRAQLVRDYIVGRSAWIRTIIAIDADGSRGRRTARPGTRGTAWRWRCSCRPRRQGCGRCVACGLMAVRMVDRKLVRPFEVDGSGRGPPGSSDQGGNVDERSRVLMATCLGAVVGGVWGWLYLTRERPPHPRSDRAEAR